MKKYENELYLNGYKYVAGLDEVGRGCIAGPLVAAMVIFKPDYINNEIKDSKLLNHQQRIKLDQQIKDNAICWEVFEVDPFLVDQLNPKQASRYAMLKCVEKAKIKPDFLLIDFEKLDTNIKQLNLVKGDKISQSIAAASIIAKVYRDRIMIELDKKYPEYKFKDNKGYLTMQHKFAINEYGPIKNVHRYSYKPIKK